MYIFSTLAIGNRALCIVVSPLISLMDQQVNSYLTESVCAL